MNRKTKKHLECLKPNPLDSLKKIHLFKHIYEKTKDRIIHLDQTDFNKGPLEFNSDHYIQLYNYTKKNNHIKNNYSANENNSNYCYIQLDESIKFDPIQIENGLYNTNHLPKNDCLNDCQKKHYSLGIFAAIVFKNASNLDNDDSYNRGIIFDFNGYSIEQSRQHTLLQRFFSIFELAQSPFIAQQGPNPVNGKYEEYFFGKNIFIIDSQKDCDSSHKDCYNFGKSTHYGIHGNYCENIYLYNLKFKDYQVAGISINKPTKLTIDTCKLKGHDKDKGLRGTYSTIMFLRRYLDKLTLTQQKCTINGNKLPFYDDIKHAINKIGEIIIDNDNKNNIVDILYNKLWNGKDEKYKQMYRLFANEYFNEDEGKIAVQDCGSYYGILIGGKGVQVNGFAKSLDEENAAKIVIISNTEILNTCGNPNETIGLGETINNKFIKLVDPIGSALNLFIKYKNPHSDKFFYLNFESESDTKEIEYNSDNRDFSKYKFRIDKSKDKDKDKDVLIYNYILIAQTMVNKAIEIEKKKGITIENDSIDSILHLPHSQIKYLDKDSDLWENYKKWLKYDPTITLEDLMGKKENQYRNLILNVDQMFHIIKGCNVLKIDNCITFKIDNLTIKNVINYGQCGSNLNGCNYLNGSGKGILHQDNKGEDTGYKLEQNVDKYQGCLIRGLSLSSCQNIDINILNLDTIISHNSAIYGIDLLFDTIDIHKITKFVFKNISIGIKNVKNEYSYEEDHNPTIIPCIKCINDFNLKNKTELKSAKLRHNKTSNMNIYFHNYKSNKIIISNNCLLEGSIINTDKGRKMIQDICTNDHIHGMKVKHLHKILNKSQIIFLIKKNTFKLNVPNKDTYITGYHKILIYNKYYTVSHLSNKFKNIKKIDLNQQFVYNIELEKYSYMIVNNMIVETYQ